MTIGKKEGEGGLNFSGRKIEVVGGEGGGGKKAGKQASDRLTRIPNWGDSSFRFSSKRKRKTFLCIKLKCLGRRLLLSSWEEY